MAWRSSTTVCCCTEGREAADRAARERRPIPWKKLKQDLGLG